MPDGRVHASVSVLTALYSGGASIYAYFKFEGVAPTVLSTGAGALAGLLITPDLDLDAGNPAHLFLKGSVFAEVLHIIWKVYWFPYAKLVPHRSWVSHLPFISTLIRVAYVFWWVYFIWPDWWDPMWAFWFVFGLCLSDLNHWFLDMTVKAW